MYRKYNASESIHVFKNIKSISAVPQYVDSLESDDAKTELFHNTTFFSITYKTHKTHIRLHKIFKNVKIKPRITAKKKLKRQRSHAKRYLIIFRYRAQTYY